jgi:hypothetical protein
MRLFLNRLHGSAALLDWIGREVGHRKWRCKVRSLSGHVQGVTEFINTKYY